LDKNEKVEQHIRKKTHKPNVLKFWVKGGVISFGSLVPPFTHLYGTRLPETSINKTFDTGSNCTRPSRKPTALRPLVRKIRGEKPGDLKELNFNFLIPTQCET